MKNYPYSNSNCSVTNNNTQDCSLNNASMKNMHRSMNRNQLMEHINQVSFAVDEVKLYLDTRRFKTICFCLRTTDCRHSRLFLCRTMELDQ